MLLGIIQFLYSFELPQKVLITKNGNLLFYNSPSAITIKNYLYISYVTNDGKVIVKKYLKTNKKITFIQEYIVHNYGKLINKKIGKADDHSAPAIIYDNKRDRILLATAYHGTDLHLYQLDIKNNKFSLLKTFKGKYTYPRLMSWKHNIYILYRSQPDVNKGDLVLKSTLDNFDKEYTIVKAEDGTVIYASNPFVFQDSFFITYSTHLYSENRLKGWKVVQVKFSDLIISQEINLEKYLDTNYFANRPTSIAVNKKSIIVSTAFYFNEWQKTQNYKNVNKVVILQLNFNNINNGKILHSNSVYFPYYATSISLDEKGNYVYFEKNKIYSSLNSISSCKIEKT